MRCSVTKVAQGLDLSPSVLCCDLDFPLFDQSPSRGCVAVRRKVPGGGLVVVVLVV